MTPTEAAEWAQNYGEALLKLANEFKSRGMPVDIICSSTLGFACGASIQSGKSRDDVLTMAETLMIMGDLT